VGRTTSSHLHVVSAGNSQRNSSAVSECQEELSNTIILLSTTRRRVENQPSNLTKHQHYSPSIRKGMMPPFVCTPTMENGLGHSIFLPDNSLRFPRLLSTRWRGGTDRKDTVKTNNNTAITNSLEHIFTNTIILCQQRVDTLQTNL
jgi:hypothetical protein